MLDSTLVEALNRLHEGCLGHRHGDVMHTTGFGRGAITVALALLVGEDRDQASVARIEIEVALGLIVEVRLLEDKGHPEQALPEVDRCLPIGSGDRDVVDPLALQLS